MVKKLSICPFILAVSLTLVPRVAIAQTFFNRIVELRGEVKVQRRGTTNYQTAFQGMTLTVGDKLLVDEGAVVTVNCSDGKLRKAQAGADSGLQSICPNARSTDPRTATPIFLELLRGDYIYQALLLTENPTLVWPSISGAGRYRVKVKAGDEVIWEKVVEGTSIRYEGEPLRPKFVYNLVVEAMDEGGSAPYQIKLRQTEIAPLIQAKVQEIKAQSVNEEIKGLMLADYFTEVEKPGFLFAAAMPLEKLVKAGNKTTFIHRLLGDIYLRLGRWKEAKESYQKTILLAEAETNSEEMAAAKLGLAQVAVIQDDLSQAKELLLEANKIYQLSGDKEQVSLIQGWLIELND